MPTTNIANNFYLYAPTPLDAKYMKATLSGASPYNDEADVNAYIHSSYRYQGLTVAIFDTELKEYWYKDGTEDTDLVEKNPASTSGVTTMAVIGSVPNANGATISGSTLTLQPADSSFGGVVTTSNQTWAGVKTFTTDIQVNNIVNIGGLLVTGTHDYVKTGGWSLLGADAATGTIAKFGGYRSSEWQGVELYTSGTKRLDISTSGLVNISNYVNIGSGTYDSNHGLVVRSPTNIANEGIKIWANNQTIALKLGWGAITASSAFEFGLSGTLRFTSTTADPFYFTNTNGTHFTMSGAGNFGLGYANITPTSVVDVIGSTSSTASLRLRSGVTVTTPNDGDIYQDGTHLYAYIGAAWRQLDQQGGSISLAAIGSTANANGMTLSGATLNLEPASASFGGVVTTTTQTFAGSKTFNSDLTVNGITVGKGAGSIASNTALGTSALAVNTTGYQSTAIGKDALAAHTNGNQNTAVGYYALKAHINGQWNTAVGDNALSLNTVGSENTGIGASALKKSTGDYNTSIGSSSMFEHLTGLENCALGMNALGKITTGSYNTAIGSSAGTFIASAYVSNTTSNNSVFIGAYTRAAASSETNQIVIGYNTTGDGSNTVVIGNSSITSTRLRGQLKLPNYGLGTVTGTATYALGVDSSGNVIETALSSVGGGGDMLLGTSQIVTAAKTFLDGTFALRNVANTFIGQFTNTNTAHRTYTLPDANGTIALLSNITGTNSGTNTGDITLAAIGSTANANGASLSGQQLTLQPADVSFGGVVTTSAQTFAGVKTFNNNIELASDGTVDGGSKSIIFYGEGSSSNIQQGSINLDSAGGLNGEFMVFIAGGNTVRFGSNGIDTLNGKFYANSANGMNLLTNSLTNGFQLYNGYLQTSGLFLDMKKDTGGTPVDLMSMTYAGVVKINDLAGSGTRMVVASATGELSTQAIPSGADGGVLSMSAIGATPNANGGTITGTVLNLQPASVSFGGIITTGTQSFAGNKTFTGTIICDTNDIEVVGSSNGYILESPNGSRWRVTVDNSGNLTTTSI